MASEKELKIVISGDSSGGESAINRIAETAAGVGLANVVEKVASFGIDFVQESMKIANETEKTYRQLDAVLTSTGRASEITRSEIDKLASSLSANSEFSKSAMIQMETLLLQYDKIGKDVLPKASQAMIDFAARTGADPVSAARALGMALQEPFEGLNRLRSMGIKVSEDQKKLMDSFKATGNSAKAQELILQLLNKQYGGAAAANIDEYDKLQKQLNGTIKALQIVVGTYVMQALTPMVQRLIPIISTTKDLITQKTNLRNVLKMSEGEWNKLVGIIRNVGIVIGTLLLPVIITSAVQWGISTAALVAHTIATTAHSIATTYVTSVTQIWTAAQWLLNIALNANPVAIVTMAILALAAGIIYAYNHSETFRKYVDMLWSKLKEAGGWIKDTFTPIIMGIVDAFNAVVSAISNAISKVKEFMGLKAKAGGGGGGAWASGGLVSEGGTALVGEMGPELVNLPAGSFVQQSASTRASLAQGNTATVNIYNPSVRSDSDIREIVRQIKKALGRENELVRLGALG